MTTITTAADLETWIANTYPDVWEHGLEGVLSTGIQRADHPAWGTDWSKWLAEHVPAMVEALA